MSNIPFISPISNCTADISWILKELSFLFKRNAMHYNIKVIQALERVYKVIFTNEELYSICFWLIEYNSSSMNVTYIPCLELEYNVLMQYFCKS